MEKIIRNRARCKCCGDIIESRYTHEYVKCSCQAIAVDGGTEYIRRCFKDDESVELLEELSEFEVIDEED